MDARFNACTLVLGEEVGLGGDDDCHVDGLVEGLGGGIVTAEGRGVFVAGQGVVVASDAGPCALAVGPAVGGAAGDGAVGGVSVVVLAVWLEGFHVVAVVDFAVDVHGDNLLACTHGVVDEIALGLLDGRLVDVVDGLGGDDLCVGAHGGDAQQGGKYNLFHFCVHFKINNCFCSLDAGNGRFTTPVSYNFYLFFVG